MSTDLLNVAANERIDLGDFRHAVDVTIQENLRQINLGMMTDPAKQQLWILDGFEMDNPAGKQLRVTKGRAILGQREGAIAYEGVLTTEGDATKIVDMSLLASTTYNVYIRFEYVEGDSSSRIFWDATGTEVSQTHPTRRNANWSVRVETSSPGAEWLLIGTANNAGGSLVIVDQRALYFEGVVSDSYESGWSSEGGGVATDRNADRQQYGVTDFQTFSAAMRQCLTDIRGRGLREWYEKGIGGLNVGFDADPAEGVLAVGDADFSMYYDATQPAYNFDASTWIDFHRTSHTLRIMVEGYPELALLETGGAVLRQGLYVGNSSGTPTDDDIRVAQDGFFGGGVNAGGSTDPATGDGIFTRGLLVGSDGSPTDNDVRAAGDGFFGGGVNAGGSTDPATGDGIFTRGLVVGFDGAPADNEVQIGDSLFRLVRTDISNIHIYFDTNDFIQFSRSGNDFLFKVANVTEMKVGNTGLNVANGIFVGDTSTDPTDNELRTQGDIHVGGRQLYFGLASNDYIDFNDTENYYSFFVDAVAQVKVGTPGVQILAGLVVGNTSTVPTDNDIYCEGTIDCLGDLTAGSITMTGNIFTTGNLGRDANDYLVWSDNVNMAVYVNGNPELTVGTLAVDFHGNNISSAGNIDGTGDLTMGSITMAGDIYTTGQIGRDSTDYIDWQGNDYMRFVTNGVEEMRLDADGLRILNGLYVGTIAGPATDNDIYAQGSIGCGTTIDAVGDATFGTITMTGFTVDADGDVACKTVRATNGPQLTSTGITQAEVIAGASSIDGSGDLTMGTITMTGFSVDADGDVITKTCQFGATNHYCSYNGTDPFYYVDSGDYLTYDRSQNHWQWWINNTERMRLSGSGLAVEYGLFVGDAQGTLGNVGDGIFTAGLSVGHSSNPLADIVTVGGTTHGVYWDGTDGKYIGDSNDILLYDRSANNWEFYISNVLRYRFGADEVRAMQARRYVTTVANAHYRNSTHNEEFVFANWVTVGASQTCAFSLHLPRRGILTSVIMYHGSAAILGGQTTGYFAIYRRDVALGSFLVGGTQVGVNTAYDVSAYSAVGTEILNGGNHTLVDTDVYIAYCQCNVGNTGLRNVVCTVTEGSLDHMNC